MQLTQLKWLSQTSFPRVQELDHLPGGGGGSSAVIHIQCL